MKGNRCLEMQVVRAAIKKEYYKFKQLSFFEDSEEAFFKLLYFKVNSLPLRGYFSTKVVEYINEETSRTENPFLNDLLSSKLPFIIEVVITIQYYHNQILDGKGGVLTNERIKVNLLKSNLLKDLLYNYIENSVPENITGLVFQYVNKMFRYTDIGQFIEKKYNTFGAYKDDDKRIIPFKEILDKGVDLKVIDFLMEKAKERQLLNLDDEFLKLYFIRIYLVSATLFKLTSQLIFELLELETGSKLTNNLEKFAEYYGVMLQLVNDNCDWVPAKFKHKTVAKGYNDAFCDLKNRNVTFPLFMYLENHHGGGIKQFLLREERDIPNTLQEIFFQEIISTGAIKNGIKLGKLTGLKALSFLNKENSSWNIFEDMIMISHFNKYYYHFYERLKKIPA